MMRAIFVLMICNGLIGCGALMPADAALCVVTRADRAALNAGLMAHPETPAAVGDPAVGLLVDLSVCGS